MNHQKQAPWLYLAVVDQTDKEDDNPKILACRIRYDSPLQLAVEAAGMLAKKAGFESIQVRLIPPEQHFDELPWSFAEEIVRGDMDHVEFRTPERLPPRG